MRKRFFLMAIFILSIMLVIQLAPQQVAFAKDDLLVSSSKVPTRDLAGIPYVEDPGYLIDDVLITAYNDRAANNWLSDITVSNRPTRDLTGMPYVEDPSYLVDDVLIAAYNDRTANNWLSDITAPNRPIRNLPGIPYVEDPGLDIGGYVINEVYDDLIYILKETDLAEIKDDGSSNSKFPPNDVNIKYPENPGHIDGPQIQQPQNPIISEWAVGSFNQALSLNLIPAFLRTADLTTPITRLEFTSLIVRIYETAMQVTLPVPRSNPFTDTTESDVLKAYQAGLIAGISPNEFAPDSNLTREQASVIFTRLYLKIITNSVNTVIPSYTRPVAFIDDASISDWAKESVYYMVSLNLISGIGEQRFAPRNITLADFATNYADLTREQAIILALRVYLQAEKYAVSISEQPSFRPNDIIPVAKPYPITLIGVGNNAMEFILTQSFTDGTIEDIVAQLEFLSIIPPGSDVNEISFNGHGGIYIDMNEAYGQGVRSTGIAGLASYLSSFVNTLLNYYEEEYVIITVDNNILVSGYNSYEYPQVMDIHGYLEEGTIFDDIDPWAQDYTNKNQLYLPYLDIRQIYLPSDHSTLEMTMDYGYKGPEQLLKRLIKAGLFNYDCAVKSTRMTDAQDVLYIDMNAAFGQAMQGLGSEQEALQLAAFVNTMLENSFASSLRLTVEGLPLVTGHDEYSYNLVKRDIEGVKRLLINEFDDLWLDYSGYYTNLDNEFRFVHIYFNLTDASFDYGLEASEYGGTGSALVIYSLGENKYIFGVRRGYSPHEYSPAEDYYCLNYVVELDVSDAPEFVSVLIHNDDQEWLTYALKPD